MRDTALPHRAVSESPEASAFASPAQALAATFESYFSTVSAIHLLATGRDAGDAPRLVQLRRDLSRQTNEIWRLLADAIRFPDPDCRLGPVLAESSTMFSDERAAVANPQARWNAPALKRDRPTYEADTTTLFRLHEKNHHWRTSVLLPALARQARYART